MCLLQRCICVSGPCKILSDVNVTDVYARGVNVNLTPLTSKRGALATDARGCSLWRYLLERQAPTWEYRVRDPLGTRYEFGLCGPRRGCYIGALSRTGVRFRGVNVTDVYARGVNVNLTPLTSKRGALATDARGCSLWRYLLERPPPTWESRVRDPLGTRYEFGLCGPGRGCYMNAKELKAVYLLHRCPVDGDGCVLCSVS